MSLNIMRNEGVRKFYKFCYDKIKRECTPLRNFCDISDIFDDQNKTIYIDGCHVGEENNRIIADKIFSIIKGDLS